MANILITGASGFIGGHLAKALEAGNTVTRTSRKSSVGGFVRFDPADSAFIGNIDMSRYDAVCHLSAQASVHVSFDEPIQTMTDNVTGVVNMIRLLHGKKAKLVMAGSAEIYRSSMISIDERSPTEPRSPYGVTKLAADVFLQGMAKQLGMNVTILRTFNVAGPGQGTKFALPSFAKQLADIEAGRAEPKIYVGNLSAVRDFTDVRDVVRAYELVLNVDERGEAYNICSGAQFSMRELLERLIRLSGVEVEVVVSTDKLRPVDVPVYVGDNTKFCKRFGWKPEHSIDDTLKTLLDHWRAEVGK